MDVYGYESMLVYQVNKYEAPDGSKPFGKAPDSQLAICSLKMINWSESVEITLILNWSNVRGTYDASPAELLNNDVSVIKSADKTMNLYIFL